ncbi:MAG: hypothetical protein K0R99_4301 [Microbacterium sp.]|jgi:hypothetical protein|uniref:hypothetical protein n=1 Tax=Microbacterium sp. TaxID=51671 RepID=UPI0026080F28|nr:hypothetical protein [Microbacterium sp.]MDF2562855.1 hypothetical protein [Microbacterium sp.]
MTLSLPYSVSDVCTACRAEFHDECSTSFIAEGETDCCCGGTATLREVHMLLTAAEAAVAKGIFGSDAPEPGTRRGGKKDALFPGEFTVEELPAKGDSGYIHPDAWPSTEDIGTLVDPASTGRKRQAKMYEISVGQVCEWAGKAGMLGGGIEFMVGCVNNPATDLHHGPDKNTLNNEKASWGVGTQENTHVICSECHNMRHAKDDRHYPGYDRVADQAKPWLPIYPDGYEPEVREATTQELWAEEDRRKADRDRRGRKTRGRNSGARAGVNTDITDD